MYHHLHHLLAGAAVLYVAVLARRASPRLLAYAVPVLMLASLAWLAVVDFRFATSSAERLHTSGYRWYEYTGTSVHDLFPF